MSLVFAPEILSTNWNSSNEADTLNEISMLDELAGETIGYNNNWVESALTPILAEDNQTQRLADENSLAANLWAQLGDVYLTWGGDYSILRSAIRE